MTLIRSAAPLAFAAALLLSACGSDDPVPPQEALPAKQQEQPGTATTVSDAQLWHRHDAPPAGVPRQVDFYGIGDQLCGPPQPGPPHIDIDQRPFYQTPVDDPAGPSEAEIGETISFCPRGFPDDGPVEMRVHRADGREYRTRGAADDNSATQHFLDGTWPTGPIDVTARQGDTVAHLRVTVILPRHHGVRTKQAFGPDPDNPFDVVMVGQPPSQKVLLDVYRNTGEHDTYITSLTATSDRRGIAQLRLHFADDVNNSFVLRARSSGASLDQDEYGTASHCIDDECR